MRHRLAAQLSFGIAVVAFVAGAAMADSSTPAATSEQTGQNSVSIQADSPVAVTVSNDHSQNAGPGSGGSSNGPSSSDTQIAPTAQSSDNAGSGGLGGPTSSDPNLTGGTSGPSVVTTTNPPATPQGPTPQATVVSDATSAAISQIVRLPQLSYAAVTPVAKPSAAPQSSLPTPFHSSAGWLAELHTLLSSTTIPTLSGLHSIALPLVAALATTLVISLIIGAFSLNLPGNSYTARLRQSGFLGAARSNVAAIRLSFATPLEMGCINARALDRAHF